ncbi:MAG: insulinase family protein, partial [Terrimicrobiaceae bacterium]|nr:insulinase family protein [Terrimicrobiaceae bacterium]
LVGSEMCIRDRFMASLLEKSTTKRSAREMAERIEGAGGSFDSDSANNTWSASVRVMSPDLELGFETLAEMVRNPAFDPSEIETERAYLLAAIKAEEEQITSVAHNLTRQAYFGSHPYALRPSGSPEAVARFTRDDLAALHQRLAVARNGVVAVVGDVKFDEVKRLAEKYFGSMPAGESAFQNLKPPTPPAKPVEVSRAMDKNQAVLMFAFPCPAVASKDRAAVDLLLEASNDLGSRFFDRIREQMGLAYFVGATNLTGPVPGCLIFYLGTDPAKLEEVKAAFREEIAKLAEEGLTPEEFARAKKKLLGKAAIRDQDLSAFASGSANSELLGLGYDFKRREAEEIEAVTLEQVRETARKYLGSPGYVQAVVLPKAGTGG